MIGVSASQYLCFFLSSCLVQRCHVFTQYFFLLVSIMRSMHAVLSRLAIFAPLIWISHLIFGDGIKSNLPFKIFFTLIKVGLFSEKYHLRVYYHYNLCTYKETTRTYCLLHSLDWRPVWQFPCVFSDKC